MANTTKKGTKSDASGMMLSILAAAGLGELIPDTKHLFKIVPITNIDKISFLRGSGISKSQLSETGKNKVIHYGSLYTIYNDIEIRKIKQNTNVDGRILSQIGDVLVPGTTTAGKWGISIGRALNIDNVIIGGDINIIRTHDPILSKWIALCINGCLKSSLSKLARGITIIHLTNNDIKTLEIPLPPKNIMLRTFAKLEEILPLVERYAELERERVSQCQAWAATS